MSDTHSIVRPNPVSQVPSKATAELVEASNPFAFELWRQLGRAGENIAASPASIHLALSMVLAGALDDLTRLVLINAVYFLGKWVEPFDKVNTKRLRFFLETGGFALVPTMTQTRGRLYHSGRDLKILELPYLGDDLAMTILLPDTVDGLPAL